SSLTTYEHREGKRDYSYATKGLRGKELGAEKSGPRNTGQTSQPSAVVNNNNNKPDVNKLLVGTRRNLDFSRPEQLGTNSVSWLKFFNNRVFLMSVRRLDSDCLVHIWIENLTYRVHRLEPELGQCVLELLMYQLNTVPQGIRVASARLQTGQSPLEVVDDW